MLNYRTRYPGQIDTDPAYPLGKARNETVEGDNTGTPLEQDWVNDVWGFFQALLQEAGISPNGLPESANASNLYRAIEQLQGGAKLAVLDYEIGDLHSLGSKNVSSEASFPQDATLSADGTKMYVLDRASDAVYQYTLNTPWDPSTASSSVVSLNIGTEAPSGRGLVFKPDGTKMYIVDATRRSVLQYALSAPWEVSSASAEGTPYFLGSADEEPVAIGFRDSGDKMFMLGFDSSTVYEYSLSQAWNVSTASPTGSTAFVGTQDHTVTGMDFSSDGSRMFIVGFDNRSVYEYKLSPSWSVNQFSFVRSLTYQGITPSAGSIKFGKAGRYLYMLGSDDPSVFQVSSSKVIAL